MVGGLEFRNKQLLVEAPQLIISLSYIYVIHQLELVIYSDNLIPTLALTTLLLPIIECMQPLFTFKYSGISLC